MLGGRNTALGVAAAIFVSAAAWAQEPASPFGEFDPYVEQAMKDWRVPGLAIAIVKGDQVVYLKGFGHRDIEKRLPVTPDTLFAIGSATKAFTSFAVGLLVDDGALDWETPARHYLPRFELADPVATAQVTLTDMLSHRTGLPRHDLLWYNNNTLSRAELVRRMAHLEFSAPIRSKWQYNNLMYMAAGHVIEVVSGQSWEDFTRARILKPLGMKRTNFSAREMQRDRNHATPYTENDDREVEAIPQRSIDTVGPAGSINSTVRDVAQWMRVHLNGGRLGEKVMISAARIETMHAPHMPFGGKPEFDEFTRSSYGLGWVGDTYRGYTRIQHGGNIDGLTARVTLFPDDGIGSVILVNKGGSPLPGLLSLDILDRLKGLEPVDWSQKMLKRRDRSEAASDQAKTRKEEMRTAGTRPAHDFSNYAGVYDHPGYGELVVEQRGDKLAVVYNDMPMSLKHWHFEVFTAVPERLQDKGLEDTKLVFRTDVAGRVGALEIQMEARVAAITFQKMPDPRLSDPVYLARYVGDYQFVNQIVRVELSGDTLMLSAPGQPPSRLVAEIDGSFAFEELRSIALRFVEGEGKGDVTGVKLLQPGGVHEFPRVEAGGE